VGRWLVSCFIAGYMGRFIPSRPLVETLNYEVRKFLDLPGGGPANLSRALSNLFGPWWLVRGVFGQ
jgi:hypothetical protein